jgi:hypothetical protein
MGSTLRRRVVGLITAIIAAAGADGEDGEDGEDGGRERDQDARPGDGRLMAGEARPVEGE